MNCRTLQESQQSRIRAWKALQGLREVITAVAVDDLPAPSKPPCFETEGEMLRNALIGILSHLQRDLQEMEKEIERMKPFISNTTQDGSYPHALLQFNRARNKLKERAGRLGAVVGKR